MTEPRHLGEYGDKCMFAGNFDAGECYICYAKRKKMEVVFLRKLALSKGATEDDLRGAKIRAAEHRFDVKETSTGISI